jgi:hypothetical protein
MTSSAPAKIRTEHLSNLNPHHYRYTNLLVDFAVTCMGFSLCQFLSQLFPPLQKAM